MPDESNPLGEILRARREAANLSIRAAAREAGFSEGRWRQLESGYELRQGRQIPVNPKPSTVVQAADALGIDAREALELAGVDADLGKIRATRLAILSVEISNLSRTIRAGTRPKNQQIESVMLPAKNFADAIDREQITSRSKIAQSFKDKIDYLEDLVDALKAHTTSDHGNATLNLSASGTGHILELGRAVETDRAGPVNVRAQAGLASGRGEARAPAAVVSGRGEVASPGRVADAQLLDAVLDLSLDDLRRLREMTEGAILEKEYPDIEEELAQAAARMMVARHDVQQAEEELAKLGGSADLIENRARNRLTRRLELKLMDARHIERNMQREYSLISARNAQIQRFKSMEIELKLGPGVDE